MTTDTTTNSFATGTLSTGAVERVRFSRLWWVGLLAIVLSVIANLAVRAIALALFTVSPDFMPLGTYQPTIVFTVIGVLAAVIVFAIVGRFARKPARTYAIIAIVALLLSLIPDVMMIFDPVSAGFPNATPAAAFVLMAQHVVAAVITVSLLNTQAVETLPAKK